MNNFFKSPFFTDTKTQTMFDDQASAKEHESQYSQINIEKEIKRQTDNTLRSTQYTDDAPLGLAIDSSKHIKTAIDIGSGTGWATNLLSETKEVVYGIEPSISAIKIAKTIHSNNKKITWVNDTAQNGLKNISVQEPVLINSLCVLSHLKDNVVMEICKEINRLAKPGSVLSFSECYGCDYDDGNLWHVRAETWWKEQLPGWKFDFCGRTINHPQGARKNFLATKL